MRKVQSPLLQIFTFVNMTILSNDIYFFMRKMEESNCALKLSPMHRRSVLLVHNSFVYYSWHFLFIWFRLVLWSWLLSLCYASLSYIMTKVFASYWHFFAMLRGIHITTDASRILPWYAYTKESSGNLNSQSEKYILCMSSMQ